MECATAGSDLKCLILDYILNAARYAPAHTSCIAFSLEHRNDGFRAFIAEQLAERFFVVANAMFIQQRNEMLRGETRQRGAAEMWIIGKIVFRLGIQIGEVVAPAAGD